MLGSWWVKWVDMTHPRLSLSGYNQRKPCANLEQKEGLAKLAVAGFTTRTISGSSSLFSERRRFFPQLCVF